jgi:hypothetical protein
MGNYCSSGDSQTLAYGEFKISISLHRVIRLQAWARGYLARQRLRSIRTTKVRGVLSKYFPGRNNMFFRIISLRSNQSLWGK